METLRIVNFVIANHIVDVLFRFVGWAFVRCSDDFCCENCTKRSEENMEAFACETKNNSETKYFDIVVCGASLGGTIAAYAAAGQGKKVVLLEESDRVGGQLTSQAVPPDEHKWIETQGCTASYRAYRNAVRDSYRADTSYSDDVKRLGCVLPCRFRSQLCFPSAKACA